MKYRLIHVGTAKTNLECARARLRCLDMVVLMRDLVTGSLR